MELCGREGREDLKGVGEGGKCNQNILYKNNIRRISKAEHSKQ